MYTAIAMFGFAGLMEHLSGQRLESSLPRKYNLMQFSSFLVLLYIKAAS